MPRNLSRTAFTVAVMASAAGCGAFGDDGMRLSSPDVKPGRPIPERITCVGDNTPPLLRWERAPTDTRGFAVVVEDLDAPRATFTNWIVTGLRSDVRRAGGGPLPEGAVESRTSSSRPGYTGPCPPRGERHRLRFRVHALRQELRLDPATDPVDARRQIEELTLAVAQLQATHRGS